MCRYALFSQAWSPIPYLAHSLSLQPYLFYHDAFFAVVPLYIALLCLLHLFMYCRSFVVAISGVSVSYSVDHTSTA